MMRRKKVQRKRTVSVDPAGRPIKARRKKSSGESKVPYGSKALPPLWEVVVVPVADTEREFCITYGRDKRMLQRAYESAKERYHSRQYKVHLRKAQP